jgi:hypothetical protein
VDEAHYYYAWYELVDTKTVNRELEAKARHWCQPLPGNLRGALDLV